VVDLLARSLPHVNEAELGRRIAVYLRLDLPEGATLDVDEAGRRLAARLRPLLASGKSQKEALDLLWDELYANYVDVAKEISFKWSGSTDWAPPRHAEHPRPPKH
jgi:hypothetical protein